MRGKFYHYTECGLNNIYLTNGYSVDKEGSLTIQDIVGLHRAIGFSLVHSGKKFTGCEIRFIRHYMDISQKALGNLLSVDYQTILRWETNKARIGATADKLLRVYFVDYLNEETPVKNVIDAISEIDNGRSKAGSEFNMSHRRDGWKKAA